MKLQFDDARNDRVVEDIIDPALPIIDAHHHLIDGDHSYMYREFFADLNAGHRVYASVYLQCRAMYDAEASMEMAPVGETSFASGVAAMAASGDYGNHRALAAIVGYAEMRLGAAIRPVLEAHIEAGAGRFKGIRFGTLDHDDSRLALVPFKLPKGILGSTNFREAFKLLAPLNLSFDAFVYFTQLDEVYDLAKAFPQTTIVLNHIGMPCFMGPYEGKADEVFAIWRRGMARVAECPNVFVKLGALGMADFFGFDFGKRAEAASSAELAAAWKPLITPCIEIFGPERCMFESNFPVDKRSASYRTIWNTFKRIVADASQADKAHLFSGAAARAYRLEAIRAQFEAS
jgi:predicted TIM-barrel fold metal-dependent hydrolase